MSACINCMPQSLEWSAALELNDACMCWVEHVQRVIDCWLPILLARLGRGSSSFLLLALL